MIEGQPFLYQARNGIVYHVNEKGVQVIGSWPSSEDIVAFVDGDKDGHEPADMLLQDNVRIILASPPKVATARWVQQRPDIKIITTELWSCREVFVAGFVLRLLLSMLG